MEHAFSNLIEYGSLIIELIAVGLIIVWVLYSSTRYLLFLTLRKQPSFDSYTQYNHSLGKALLLGLEILVAADVVRTVALEPTL